MDVYNLNGMADKILHEDGANAAEITDAPNTTDASQPQRYNPAEIEPKWQARWDADATLYAAEPHDSGKPKYYCLEMLPYPTGQLHMGHVRNYAIGDALARYMWMRGYNVLHPMGWDAFGLPAENAALKNNTPPREWTLANIAAMSRQMQRMGLSYDWATEVTTCLPDYYRWNQWFFLKMYERGLAYRKKSKVNWCPECATVLANEQVIDGCCWRHEDTLVEQRDLEQWFLRITQVCGRAAERARQAGRLAGESPHHAAQLDRPQRRRAGRLSRSKRAATREDYGLHHAHRHDLRRDQRAARAGASDGEGLRGERCRRWRRRSRTMLDAAEGGARSGRHRRDREARRLHRALRHQSVQRRARADLGGELRPADYGTGAIMSVPAHDERDFEFAKKYGLEIKRVIRAADVRRRHEPDAAVHAEDEPC